METQHHQHNYFKQIVSLCGCSYAIGTTTGGAASGQLYANLKVCIH